MVGNPRRLEARNQTRQFVQITGAQWIAAAQIERHAMQNDRRLLACSLQNQQGTAAANHEIFADYFKPVGPGAALHHPPVVRGTEPYAMTEVRKVSHGVIRGAPARGLRLPPIQSVGLLLFRLHRAALVGTVFGAAHFLHALALACILALAVIVDCGAGALTLTTVDAQAFDLGRAGALIGPCANRSADE